MAFDPRGQQSEEIGVLSLICWGRKPKGKGNFESIWGGVKGGVGQPERQAQRRLSPAVQRPKGDSPVQNSREEQEEYWVQAHEKQSPQEEQEQEQ